MEILFKCPTCGSVTIEVKGGACNSNIICPKCLREGISSIMSEQKNESYQNLGGGLFSKPKN
jgi:uncharacterized Zn finger protein (UPF0148 family)